VVAIKSSGIRTFRFMDNDSFLVPGAGRVGDKGTSVALRRNKALQKIQTFLPWNDIRGIWDGRPVDNNKLGR